MSTIQKTDLFTGETVDFVETDLYFDGSTMIDLYIDNILYIKEGGNFYKRYFDDHINVRWFGAKGDGQTDDTASIQTAFNFLFEYRDSQYNVDSSPSLCCFIPDGNYKITDTLVFPTFCTLKGASTNGTRLFTERNDISLLFLQEVATSANNDHNDIVRPTYNTAEEYTTVYHLTLAGPLYNTNTSIPKPILGDYNSGILIQKTIKVKIQNVYIAGFETAGIYCHNSYYINISNCTLYSNRIGLLADGMCTCIFVENSTIRVNSVGAIIRDNSFGCNFVSTVFESNSAHFLPFIDFNRSPYSSSSIAIVIHNSYSINFSGCYFENQIVTMILDNARQNSFSDCYFCSQTEPFTNPPTDIPSHLVWFYGSNSSNNKFINNFYTSSAETQFQSHKFLYTDIESSVGNVFDLNSKNQLDLFISQNVLDFNEFRNLGFAKNAPKFICTGANEQYIDAERRCIIDEVFGSTSNRPSVNLYNGQYYFDTDIVRPIYWQGSKWVKSDGTDA